MGFLTPFMLWGALAAGIPVAIHFLFRTRYRTVPWAAMKFLLTSVEQTSRRIKFQELLLLLLRMLVLIVLALAFARPISSMLRGAGRGDSVDVVFVVDVSFTMGAKDGTKTRLERAQDEALKIIDELPAHSTVQIITCANKHMNLLGPSSPTKLDKAKELIRNLDITHLATDLQPGVAEAREVLQRGQASNKELYVFSDMQKLGWEQNAGELKTALGEIKEKAIVHLVRCGTRPIKNVAITGIVPMKGVPRPGERVAFAVLVRNTGSEAVENLTVSLEVDVDDKKAQADEPKRKADEGDERLSTSAITKLRPGESRAVTLTGKLDKAGRHVLTAKVHMDDLEVDNRFDQVIQVRDQVNILVVDGNYHAKDSDATRSSSFYLMHSLLSGSEQSAGAAEISARVVSAREAAGALLNRQDLCILVNVAVQAKAGKPVEVLPTHFAESLQNYVQGGHRLVVFSGDNVDPQAYNKLFGEKLGLLPLPLKSVVKATGKDPLLINRDSFGTAPSAFRVFKDVELYRGIGQVSVSQYVEMDESVKPDIENLRYRFYKQAWTTLPDFSKLTADEEGSLATGLFDLSPRKRNKDFGFVFEGTLVVPEAGLYTFFLDSADGAQLSISSVPIITYDGLHEMGLESENKTMVRLSAGKQPIKLEYFQHASRDGLSVGWSGPNFTRRTLAAGKGDNPLSVIARLANGKPLIAAKKIEEGEVVFIGTAAHHEGEDPKTREPLWTDLPTAPQFIPFVRILINHLLRNQADTSNLVAGQTLSWFPTDTSLETIYNLEHPSGKFERLAAPTRIGKRAVVTSDSLPRAGIYHVATLEGKNRTPIAVIPDLRESENLQTLSDGELDQHLGFEPIHITVGDSTTVSTEADRLNREWTIWALLAVLGLVLCETLLAWWCGRAW